LKLIKNRVMLRVFLYLIDLKASYEVNKDIFNAFYEEKESRVLNRGQLLSIIKQNRLAKRQSNLSTLGASRILEELVNMNYIQESTNELGLEKYINQFLINKGKIYTRASPISDFLYEDIQSVISTIKYLRKIKINSPIPFNEFKLTEILWIKENQRRFSCYALSKEGLKLREEIYELFNNSIQINENGEIKNKSIKQIYHNTCFNVLKMRAEINNFRVSIERAQKLLQQKLNECSTIRGKSLQEILYNMEKSDKVEQIKEDIQDLININLFIKMTYGDLARFNAKLQEFVKNLKNIIELQKGIFEKTDFPKAVQNMYENFKNMQKTFKIPRLLTYQQWLEVQRMEEDPKLSRDQEAAATEILTYSFKDILNSIDRIYELKFNIEEYIERGIGL
ncbi:MAG: hypothetical protein EAX96_14395, partial [Candidatus Lokiarchaeota archaeon]|nr:hypothetical protein [Candidatus Lokiarchaeota archaeon]